MDRSLGFGSAPRDWNALFGLGFPPAPGLPSLNLATQRNSQAHSTKGTPSPRFRKAPTACRSTVSVSVSLPSRGSFHLSLTVLYAIGSCKCSALGDGPPGFRQGSSCPAVLKGALAQSRGFRLRGCHPLRPAFPGRSAILGFCPTAPERRGVPTARLATPRAQRPSLGAHAVWAGALSLAATQAISVDFSSCRYLDGSLPGVVPTGLFHSPLSRQALRLAGYPIRRPADLGILAPPRSFSQLVASFFVLQLQGIPRGPLFA